MPTSSVSSRAGASVCKHGSLPPSSLSCTYPPALELFKKKYSSQAPGRGGEAAPQRRWKYRLQRRTVLGTMCHHLQRGLRTVFKKELNKVEDSKHLGAGAEAVYVPRLWYYDVLMFTRDQELPRQSISLISPLVDNPEDQSNAENIVEAQNEDTELEETQHSAVTDEQTSPLIPTQTNILQETLGPSTVYRRPQRLRKRHPSSLTGISPTCGDFQKYP
ncbi:GTPase IMAP family member GIMD1 isoform 2-T2 [Anomaloglossus baeobatrachus]|uniref:GTPase IMAP family member GIMD1 isoform X1 n=1 Tax=Anomaloglossus baeobatrachus TaxID=238106 RepID=UPI003F4F5553